MAADEIKDSISDAELKKQRDKWLKAVEVAQANESKISRYIISEEGELKRVDNNYIHDKVP